MSRVTELGHAEPAWVEPACIRHVYYKLGHRAGEELVEEAMAQFLHLLGALTRAWRASDWERVTEGLYFVHELADQLGMTGVAHVADDVAACMETGDSTALAATIARLARVGEASSLAIFEVTAV